MESEEQLHYSGQAHHIAKVFLDPGEGPDDTPVLGAAGEIPAHGDEHRQAQVCQLALRQHCLALHKKVWHISLGIKFNKPS